MGRCFINLVFAHGGPHNRICSCTYSLGGCTLFSWTCTRELCVVLAFAHETADLCVSVVILGDLHKAIVFTPRSCTIVYVSALAHWGAAFCFPTPTYWSCVLLWRSPMGLHTCMHLWSPDEGFHNVFAFTQAGYANICSCACPLGDCSLLFPTLAYRGCTLFRRSPMGLRTYMYLRLPLGGATTFFIRPQGALLFVKCAALLDLFWAVSCSKFPHSPTGAVPCFCACPEGNF
mmetsp:Transcript_33611/g.66430  ORF Transcript_33611/g.66430 Transcript_33611/m.66430 type:complete len:232 (-) Transcript_33611:1076-1771(-)